MSPNVGFNAEVLVPGIVVNIILSIFLCRLQNIITHNNMAHMPALCSLHLEASSLRCTLPSNLGIVHASPLDCHRMKHVSINEKKITTFISETFKYQPHYLAPQTLFTFPRMIICISSLPYTFSRVCKLCNVMGIPSGLVVYWVFKNISHSRDESLSIIHNPHTAWLQSSCPVFWAWGMPPVPPQITVLSPF